VIEEPLTPRETEVAALVAAALPNKLIAYELSISEYTVKNHIQNIFSKLAIGNRSELILWVLSRERRAAA
jgi:DNA-binding NarL/FixJ family response regulator